MVITDFGLARGQIADEELASISETGLVIGTPAYMAPEQVQGLKVTAAADIYALGIVLYEMVTGTRPFEGGSSLSIAARRLTEAPRSPRASVPDLDPVWEAVILRCLARNPGARFQSAMDVADTLRGGDAVGVLLDTEETELLPSSQAAGAPDAGAKPATKQRPPKWAAAGAAVLAALALGYSAYRAWWPAPQSSARSGAEAVVEEMQVRPSLAVLSFTNVSKREESAWLSTAIGEMLTTELAAGGKIRTVEGEAVAEVKRTLALADVDQLESEDLARLRRSLGVDYVAFGSFTLVGDEDPLLRVELRLVDVRTGEVATGGATGSERQIFDLVDRASQGLREHLGVEDLAPAYLVEVKASVPSDPEAARLYSEGLDHIRRSEFTEGLEVLKKAVEAAPEHPMPFIELAAAQSALGDRNSAAVSAARAVELAGHLPRREKMIIQARSHEFGMDLDSAAEIYRSLLDAFPDDVESGVRLVSSLTSSGHPQEALAAVEELRRLPAPLNEDPRLDLAEAWAHFDLGDNVSAQLCAQTVQIKAAEIGSDLLAARAKLMEVNALQTRGDLDQSMALLRETKALFESAGDHRGAASCLELMGITVWQQGDLDGAQRLLERALILNREIGIEGRAAGIQSNLGALAVDQGRMEAAERHLDEALTTFEKIGDAWAAASAQLNMGTVYLGVGELDAAVRRYREAMDGFSELGERSGVAVCLTNIADVLYLRGEIDQAWEMHGESLAINRELGDESGVAYDTFRMALVATEKGDDFVAEARFAQALEAQERMGEGMAAAETRIGFARLELGRRNAARAEELARQAEQVLRTEGVPELEALAQVALGEALVAQQRLEEARVVVARAKELADASADRRVKLHVAWLVAKYHAGQGAGDGLATALQILDRAIVDSETSGYVLDPMNARLVQLDIDTIAGVSKRSRVQLNLLAEQAKAKGLKRTENRARELATR